MDRGRAMVNAVGRDGAQLPHLETFSKAAELGSFTGAAKALRLTQAAVSQRIHALESALGTPLFRRRGGRVLLTEAGRTLYDYAQRILDLHREARREVTGHETAEARELLLAASSIPGDHLLPVILSVFHQIHPNIQVRATVGDSVAVMSQVERGEVSLGLAGSKSDSPNLEFRHLASDRMILVVPATHPWAKRRRVSLKQLSGQPLILREVGSGLRHCFEKSLERAGRSLNDFQVVLELGSNESIKESVLRGIGVAVLSAYAVGKELRAGHLIALDVGDLRCDREMYVVLDRRRVLPLTARVFLNFLETNPLADLAP